MKRLTTLTIEVRDWQVLGACNRHDPDLWFADHGRASRERRLYAKSVCFGECPVISECLQWALQNHDPYAILGGLTYRERKRITSNHPDAVPAVVPAAHDEQL
jgi:WhiB family redox-sensing transcriptional regulator